jgi:hypothetical protein
VSYTQPRHILCSVQHANFSEIGTKSTRRRSISDIFKSNIQIQSRQEGVRAQFFLRSVYRNKAVGLCELPQLSSHTVLLFRILALFTDSGGDSWGIVAIIRNIIVDFH